MKMQKVREKNKMMIAGRRRVILQPAITHFSDAFSSSFASFFYSTTLSMSPCWFHSFRDGLLTAL